MTTRSTSTTGNRAAKLPAHVPGLAREISLMDWPMYQELHQLVAMDRTEVSKFEERTGTRKESGVVWVKRSTG